MKTILQGGFFTPPPQFQYLVQWIYFTLSTALQFWRAQLPPYVWIGGVTPEILGKVFLKTQSPIRNPCYPPKEAQNSFEEQFLFFTLLPESFAVAAWVPTVVGFLGGVAVRVGGGGGPSLKRDKNQIIYNKKIALDIFLLGMSFPTRWCWQSRHIFRLWDPIPRCNIQLSSHQIRSQLIF